MEKLSSSDIKSVASQIKSKSVKTNAQPLEQKEKIDLRFLQNPPNEPVTCDQAIKTLNALKEAHDFLKNNSCPGEIRCRSSEYEQIIDFLYKGLIERSINKYCMIITGKPGSGKTLLVSNILNSIKITGKQHLIDEHIKLKAKRAAESSKIQKIQESSSTPRKEPKPDQHYNIQVILLNAVNYKHCIDLLMEVVNKMFIMSGTKYGSDLNSQNGDFLLVVLNKYMDQILSQNSFVLMVDELDTLFTHDKLNSHYIVQLYKISRERFLKIGISNTIDLGAKEKGKTMELEGLNLIFKPYTDLDMIDIADERLQRAICGYDCQLAHLVSPEVVKAVCKLGSRDAQGDIRKILENLRNMLENKINDLTVRIADNFPAQMEALLANNPKFSKDGPKPLKSKTRNHFGISTLGNSKSASLPILIKDLQLTRKDGFASVQNAENCANADSDIVSNIGTNPQMSDLMANLSQVRMALGDITLSDNDIPMALETLRTYNLIKPLTNQSLSKPTGRVKPNSKNMAGQVKSYCCTHSKESLKGMLWDIEAFRPVLQPDYRDDGRKHGDQSNLTADSYTQQI